MLPFPGCLCLEELFKRSNLSLLDAFMTPCGKGKITIVQPPAIISFQTTLRRASAAPETLEAYFAYPDKILIPIIRPQER